MPDVRKQRSVTLSADTYAKFEQAATAAGMSVAAWLAKAGEIRRRQEAADAYAAYCAQPQIAEQITGYLAAVSPMRAAAWRHAQKDAA